MHDDGKSPLKKIVSMATLILLRRTEKKGNTVFKTIRRSDFCHDVARR